MKKIAALIVDKRNLIFLIIGILTAFSAVSRNWVTVENDLTAYLPADSQTRKGLDLMEEQFVTFGSAKLMLSNVSYQRAEAIAEEIRNTTGVQHVAFDDTTDHYNHVSALFEITFDYPEKDSRCLDALDNILERYAAYDKYVDTTLGDQLAEIIDGEVKVIMVIVAVIVVFVLLLTSQTWAEVPVLILTFGCGMILNMGSSFLMGKISFVSNSVTSILQLALSLDYAVILSNRFKEEYQTLPLRDAVVEALSKGIPEIGASSLTTIGGLVAMMFMKFQLGPDLGVNLVKAIILALFSVFVFMPGLLMLFGPLMEKTRHRSFIIKIPFVGKFAWATRHVVPFAFLALVVGAYFVANNCPYVYSTDVIKTPKLNEQTVAKMMIRDNFTSLNMVALVVPARDYDTERRLLDTLDAMPQVDHTQGLSNTDALDGYKLTDRLTPRQFSELADIEFELSQLVYIAYATDREEYSKLIGGVANYGVPLIDMFLFVWDNVQGGALSLPEDTMEKLGDAASQMTNGRLQLQGEDYSRMLVYLNLPESGDETYAFTDTIADIARDFYPEGEVYVVGNSTNAYEFQKSFARDNVVVSVASILIVLAVLLFTFKSIAMPLLLILVIQGSIWINFSVPVFTHSELFFIAYLIVSSIQMGANIDYAIVIASRFMEQKTKMHQRDAIIETMDFAFPTILTSGSILAASGFILGQISSEGTIVGIGQSLGRGTVISIFLVLFILPQILLLGEKVIDMSSFSVAKKEKHHDARGHVAVDGLVHGEIHGVVNGFLRGTVDGDVHLTLLSGSLEAPAPPEEGETAPVPAGPELSGPTEPNGEEAQHDTE